MKKLLFALMLIFSGCKDNTQRQANEKHLVVGTFEYPKNSGCFIILGDSREDTVFYLKKKIKFLITE